MKKTFIVLSILSIAGIFGMGSVSAATSTLPKNVRATTTASSSIKRVAKLDQISAKLQARAEKEIDRRITALNKLAEKIQGIKRINNAQKSVLSTTIQGQINLLNNLKVKIKADTDAATLKADVQSITRAYRIYALVLPQIEILAAADKLASTTDLLTTYKNSLEIRIAEAQASGKDVTAMQESLVTMSAKISDAINQSVSAISTVTALKPDNGVKTVMESNNTALKAARTAIRKGTVDVKDAQKLGKIVANFLKSSTKAENATSTASSSKKTASTTVSN